MRTAVFGLLLLWMVGILALPTTTAAQDASPTASPEAVATPEPLPPFEGTVENGILTIVVIEEAISDQVVDLPPEGDSAGDLLVFANPVFDDTMQTMVGTDQGFCVRTNTQAKVWECTWTLMLATGQLVVQGPFYDERESSMLAITGGTGNYAGARGEMELSVVSSTEFRFTYMIIEEE